MDWECGGTWDCLYPGAGERVSCRGEKVRGTTSGGASWEQ